MDVLELTDFDALFNTLKECRVSGRVPELLMQALAAAMKQPNMKTMIRRWLGSLPEFYWDEQTGSFIEPWSMGTVTSALERMAHWKSANMGTNTSPRASTAESSEEFKETLPKWHRLVGEYRTILSLCDFVKVNKIVTPPSELTAGDQFAISLPEFPLIPSDLSNWITKILPYIIQKIKMWGCFELEPRALKSLVSEDENKDDTHIRKGPKMLRPSTSLNQSFKPSNPNNGPFSRIDLLTVIINCVDVLVAQDLLKNMAMFPIALPLIIPSIFNEDRINVIPLLRHITMKWKCKDDIVENYLFSSPFKLILAVRLGFSTKAGKSCILNQVLRREYVFSSRQEPGARFGKPVSLPGFVEFIPLTEETCKSDLWKNGIQHEYSAGSKDIVLLANLHGDPTEHPDVFNALLEMATGVVMFLMPDSESDSSTMIWNQVTGRFGPDVPYLEVDPEDSEEETSINIVELTDDVTLSKVRKAIVKAISLGKSTNYDDVNLQQFTSIRSKVANEKSEELAELVRETSCKNVKKAILDDPLLEKNATLPHIIEGLCSIVRLPLNERLLAMTDLERQVTELSNEESFGARCQLLKLEEEFKKERMLLVNAASRSPGLIDVEKRMNNLLNDINDTNLGVEHFYRLLGGYYEKALRENDPAARDLPLLYAELLLNGFAIELLDGDSSTPSIQGPWLSAICEKVCSTFGDIRVYIVTVIGLQSSGKSTLLNALFGCKFAVSVGRCTRGLFLRLLLLNEDLKRELDVDAILLIDMEGLGAPEKVNDPDADRKDRLMATFAMGISNLTLINVYGEAANCMTDILQIAIVAMARLEEAKMDPDLYIVQHLSEKNQQKLGKAHNEFIKAIQTAVKLTEEKGIHIGIINSSCLNNLVGRVEKGNVLKAFGPYKDGERVNSPPSQGYHDSIVDLYKSILEACKDCKRKLKLSVWSSILEGYLDAVLWEQMAVRFKNLTDMAEHLAREREIATTKETIERAFQSHSNELEQVVISKIRSQDINQADFPVEQEKVDGMLTNLISTNFTSVPLTCQTDKNTQCAYCSTAFKHMEELLKDKEHGLENGKTLRAFRERTKEYYEVKMKNLIGAQRLQEGCSREFYTILNSSVIKHKQGNGGTMTALEKKKICNLVWEELKHSVAEKYPYTSIKKRMEQDIIEAYPDNPHIWSGFSTEKKPELRKIPAFKEARLISATFGSSQHLDVKDYMELERHLRNLPASFVRVGKIQEYSSQVMLGVKYYIIDFIQDYVKNSPRSLLPKFLQEVHVYLLRTFGDYLVQMQAKLESQRHPLKLLEKSEKFYKNLIKTRLSLGFSAAAEGHIIARLVLQDVNAKASKCAHEKRVEKICNEQWMINSENVRLKFFEMLAGKVQKGEKNEAINYFGDPKPNIKKWFEDEVDKLYPDTDTDYNATFATELNLSLTLIRNSVDMSEISRHIDTMAGVSYKPNDIDKDSIELLKASVQSGIKEKRDSVQKKVQKPSEDRRVLARLGCVEHCHFCGALCWGHLGHEQDTGATKRHHACHQPAGLKVTYEHFSRELDTSACQEWEDDFLIRWGKYTSEGLSWKETKTQFNGWIFDAHHKNEFNQLMHWFFLKLNKNIADLYRLKPASQENMKSKGFTALSSPQVFSRILATIKQKIT